MTQAIFLFQLHSHTLTFTSAASLVPLSLSQTNNEETPGRQVLNKTGVFLLDDLIENLGMAFVPAYPNVVPILIKFIGAKEKDLRQVGSVLS